MQLGRNNNRLGISSGNLSIDEHLLFVITSTCLCSLRMSRKTTVSGANKERSKTDHTMSKIDMIVFARRADIDIIVFARRAGKDLSMLYAWICYSCLCPLKLLD